MSRRRIFKLLSPTVIVLLLIGGFFIFSRSGANLPTPIKDIADKISSGSSNFFNSVTLNDNIETYSNDKFKFSFNYPKGFSVSSFADSGGETVLIKNAAANNGFQIHISLFDEPTDQYKLGPLTKERILKDIPDMVINNTAYIAIGGERSLSFTSQDELAKETLNFWLVHGGYIYQIMAYKSFEKELLKILSSWKFLN